MNSKYYLSDVKWICLTIIILNLVIGIFSVENSIEAIDANIMEFKNNLNMSPNQYVRIASIAKQFDNIFSGLINLLLIKRDKNEIENSFIIILNYMKKGFDLIDIITANKFHLNSVYKIKSTSHKYTPIKNFLDILYNIENKFRSKFKKILTDVNLKDNATIDVFLNDTIFDGYFISQFHYISSYLSHEHPQDSKRNNITENIFLMVLKNLQNELDNVNNCGNIPIAHSIFYLYQQMTIDVIKGYAMKIVGHEFENLKESEYISLQSTHQTYYLNKYRNITKLIVIAANGIVEMLNLDAKIYRNCDPLEWKEGKNYIRVKNYVSDYSRLVKDKNDNFNLRKNVNEEFECNKYALYTNLGSVLIESLRCPEIFEIDPDINAKLCPYPWKVNFTNAIGDSAQWNMMCYSKESHNATFSSFCYCDKYSDEVLSVRQLCLQEYVTNSADSRVVTGIRFAVKDNIIIIVIQEGKLVNGTIDRNTVRWMTSDDNHPTWCSHRSYLSFKTKSFNLDNIELPFGYFVTGVKFEHRSDNHLGLAVRGTKMWDDTEYWPSSKHEWFFPKVIRNIIREKIIIKDYINSAESTTQNIVISRSGFNYVDLSVGLLSHEYNNLPVIPFFDTQDVALDPPVPLGGLGLYYKGQRGYGGFLALQLITSECSC